MLRGIGAAACIIGVVMGIIYNHFTRNPDERVVWVGLTLFLVGMGVLMKTRKPTDLD